MAEPNKAAGRSWAGGALVPAGRRAERSKTGRSGSWPLTCVRALMTRSNRLGALIATGKQRPEPNPAAKSTGYFTADSATRVNEDHRAIRLPNRCSPIGLIDFPDRTARHSSTNFDRESSRFHRARGEIEGEELRPNGAPSLVIKGQKKSLTNRRIPYIWTESSETTVYFIRKVSSRSQDGYTGSRSLEGDLQSCEFVKFGGLTGPSQHTEQRSQDAVRTPKHLSIKQTKWPPPP